LPQANLRFSKIDPSTNRVTAEVDTLVDHSRAYPEFAVGDGSLWVVSVGGPATLQRLDPDSGSVVTQTGLPWDTSVEPVGGADDIRAVSVRASSDSVWVAMTDLVGGPGQIDGTSVWLIDLRTHELVRVDGAGGT
jgi:hypothetical protein